MDESEIKQEPPGVKTYNPILDAPTQVVASSNIYLIKCWTWRLCSQICMPISQVLQDWLSMSSLSHVLLTHEIFLDYLNPLFLSFYNCPTLGIYSGKSELLQAFIFRNSLISSAPLYHVLNTTNPVWTKTESALWAVLLLLGRYPLEVLTNLFTPSSYNSSFKEVLVFCSKLLIKKGLNFDIWNSQLIKFYFTL